MSEYTNKYEVALAIAQKFGSTNDNLSNIFDALQEIAMLRGLSGLYTTKYEILKALALNEGVSGTLTNSYECLLGLAGIYGGTGFTNNYEAALYLLDNAEAGFGGMTFTAVTAGAIGMSHHGTNATTTIPRLQYSRDGETWTDWMFETLSVNAGDKIYFKGINDKISYSNTNYSNFSLTGSFKASGNIMSLLYGDDYKDKESLSGKDYCFYGLFYGTKGILTSPKLPATTLAIYCYAYMFDGTNIEKMPELPAKTLIYRCYYGMFANCKSLTETTLLPAERLIGDCYRGMFNGATSLHTVRANFITTPSDDYTEDWLNNVAEEGTFYVSKDAAWIDEITRGADTIPVNWEIKGRTPIPYVYVTIDSVSVRLRGDMTFAEQGYTELYSQAEYYPRFGQTAHDFTFNVNTYPMSGLEVFTTCTPAVHLISVTVDGNSYQVNYYTTWFANGFNELYADNEFESEAEVEEIDVDTTYPNEGDTVYTSYRIIPAWMKQAATTYDIPIDNLYNANKDYRFVEFLYSDDNSVAVIQLGNTGSNTTGMKALYKRPNYVSDSTFIGSREGTTSATRYTMGARNNNPYYGAGQFAEFTTYNIEDGEQCLFSLNYLNNRRFVVNGDVLTSSIMTIPTQTWPISVFGYTRAGEPIGTSAATYIYNILFTRGNSIESVYLTAENSLGQPIMLDLKTMTEYPEISGGELIKGNVVSLESKFAEIR